MPETHLKPRLIAPVSADIETFTRKIMDLALSSGGRIGVSVWSSASDSQFGYCDREIFPLASVTKFLTAVAALRLQEKGAIAGHHRLDDLVTAAISGHDAGASRVLSNLCGGANRINEMLVEVGCTALSVTDVHSHPENSGTVCDLTWLLHQLHGGAILSPRSAELVFRALGRQTDADGVLSGLPAGCSWLHMSGGLEDLCVDTGILQCGNGVLALSVSAQGQVKWTSLEQLVGRVGAAMYECWCR